jgi:hypothetical protein
MRFARNDRDRCPLRLVEKDQQKQALMVPRKVQ